MKTNWQTKKLGEICEVVGGGTPKTTNGKYWNGDLCWVTPKDLGKLSGFEIVNTERKISEEGLKNSSAKLLPVGSVILSSRAPIGYVFINGVEMATNQGCKSFICGSEIHNKYLFYFLISNTQYLNSLGSGTTFKEVSGATLKNIYITYPTLSEQKRIVKILDESLKKITKAKENAGKNLQYSKDLFESYSRNVFSNKEKNWDEKKLSEICIVERGSSPRPIKKFFTEDPDGVNWIKIGDTKNVNRYIYSTNQKITKAGAEKSRQVNVGDLILSNSMSFGKPYIMKTQGYIHDGWFVLRPNQNMDTEYFYDVISSPQVQRQFLDLASGSVVKNISGDLTKRAILPVPPIGEQRSIVKKLQSISEQTKKLEANYKQKIADLDELKKSLLTKAFAGEL